MVGGDWNGLRLVSEHAVGRRDDVLGGHQSPPTAQPLAPVRTDEGHHPGIFVLLSKDIEVENVFKNHSQD